MTTYLVTRENPDGTFDDVGMKNRTIVSGYRTYRNAFKFAINPFGRGNRCRVEVFHNNNVFHTPNDVFICNTTR